MIALIAEKPSVAKDIARIIGATQRNDGYLSGNGYMVTWAFGHLIQLAMPEAYGVANFRLPYKSGYIPLGTFCFNGLFSSRRAFYCITWSSYRWE